MKLKGVFKANRAIASQIIEGLWNAGEGLDLVSARVVSRYLGQTRVKNGHGTESTGLNLIRGSVYPRLTEVNGSYRELKGVKKRWMSLLFGRSFSFAMKKR
jgi:hypothetical protein